MKKIYLVVRYQLAKGWWFA